MLLIGVWILSQMGLNAQTSPFQLELEPFTISSLPGLHSYAFTQHNGKWLILGGRTNGLHGFQPPFAFPLASQNTNIYVVDPVLQQSWSVSTASLPQNIQEHIASSNMEGVRIGNYYYFIGGYGFSTPANELITFPNVTAIDVPALINAVVNQLPVTSYFRQITDPNLALCGSRAEVIDSTVFLVFGHQFDGRYNPHNMPSFTQVYSNQIRKFNISDNGTVFTINNYTSITDTVNFHRRDYNLAPQIFPNGASGITAFSGVFQYAIDRPYLNTIDITSSGYTVNNNFEQLLSQYHSALIPFYDSTAATMHTLFFGGMSQYLYDINNVLIEDTLIPFVKTISLVSRNSNQQIEIRVPYEMPGYLGSNMEFYRADGIDAYDNGIIKLTEIDTGKVLVGYLHGGIEADYPYVFMNGGGNSWASDKIFKVYITKNTNTGLMVPASGINSFSYFPNPVKDELTINFELASKLHINCSLYDTTGKLVSLFENSMMPAGKNRLIIKTYKLPAGVYTMSFNAGGAFKNVPVVITK